MRRRRLPAISQTLSKKIPEISKIEKKVITHTYFTTPVQSVNDPSTEVINRRPMIKDIPFSPDPTYRPPPKLIKIPMSEGPDNIDISPETNIDFKENSPFQEGVISEAYQRPIKSLFQESQELEGQYRQSGTKNLQKKTDIDKIIKAIQQKVLKGTHLLVTIKEIQAGYLVSPYFKDIYLHLVQDKLPSTRLQFKRWKL